MIVIIDYNHSLLGGLDESPISTA